MAHLASTPRHVRTVDALRGLCAIGVFAYHVLYYEQIASLDIVSFYAVYAFFVISGFAMYVSYRDRITTRADLKVYLLRRFWRIAPLFYAATAIHICLRPVENLAPTLMLNALLAFGFANPGATSIVTGGWSIGIEMVFYIIFPGILAIAAGRVARLAFITACAFALQFAFINLLYTSGQFDWARYTQPAAFIGYFTAGCLLGELFGRFSFLKGSRWWFAAALLALIPFVTANVDASVQLLVGWQGALLAVATVGLVVAAAFIPEPNRLFQPVAEWLGRMSYPIYLIHPLAYIGSLETIPSLSSTSRVLLAAAITVAFSEAVNRMIEQPAIRYSKRLMMARGAAST